MSSDQKSDKMSVIMYKSDLIFNILEKYLYFDRSSVSFTKFNYLSDFNLSNGIILIQKSFIKSSASLFIPELTVYLNKLIEKEEFRMKTNPRDPEETPVTSTETDILYIRCLSFLKIYQNDEKYFPQNGIFRQFTFKHDDYNKDYFVDNKINIRYFKTNVQCLKIIYQYQMKEEFSDLTKQYYIPMFLVKDEYLHNEQKRTSYVKNVIKRASVISNRRSRKQSSKKKKEVELVIHDPTLISLALIEENEIYDFGYRSDSTDLKMLIDELSEVYYTKNFKSYQTKEPSKIKIFYFDFVPYFKFLNDLALGNYTVLSETKNLFSENYELNNYQKIYEAILYLHNSKKKFN